MADPSNEPTPAAAAAEPAVTAPVEVPETAAAPAEVEAAPEAAPESAPEAAVEDPAPAPAEEAKEAPAAEEKKEEPTEEAAPKNPDPAPAPAEEAKEAPVAEEKKEEPKNPKRPAEAPAKAPAAKQAKTGALPAGWTGPHESSKGGNYWYHDATETSVWDPPPSIATPSLYKMKRKQLQGLAKKFDFAITLKNSELIEKLSAFGSMEGWTEQESSSKAGRAYFYNEATDESIWKN